MCAKRRIAAKDKKTLFSNTFYSDMEADGMLYASLVRAPVKSGEISAVIPPELPEGYALFTHKDIPGKKTIRTLGVETPIFCMGKIAYKGEPVGILVGPDENEVLRYAAHTTVQCTESAEDAGEGKETIAAERTVRYGELDDTAFSELFSEAKHVVDGVWNSTLHPISYGEPNGAFVCLKNGALHVCTSTQWLSHLRKTIAEVTGMDSKKIIITRTPVSDLNTNVLWRNAILASQVATAVCKTGKPVKLVLAREEQDVYMDNAAPVSIIYKSAVAKTGEITALDVTIDIDVGNKNPFSREILDRITLASVSIYRPKNIRIHAVARTSHQPPFSINLSTIDSQGFFAAENQMQKICEKTAFTPLELRLINCKAPNPKRDTYPFLFPCDKVKETLEAVCRSSDFLRKYTAYKLDEADRYIGRDLIASPYAPPLKGIALACAFQGCGFFGTSFAMKNTALEVTLEKDGTLAIHALPPSPAVWTVWKRMAHETLGIKDEDIRLESDFALGTEPEAPESIITNIGIYTSLFQKCLKAIKAKPNGPFPLTVKKAMAQSAKAHWDKEAFSGIPFSKASFAAAVVELELDPATYREKICGIWIVVNGGKILDVRAAEGAIKNSVQQTLAAIIEDDPIAFANVKLQFVLSNEEPSPIGDIASSIIPAAFSAALSQAVAATITSLPIKTDTVYIISEQAQKALDEILAQQQAAFVKQQAEAEFKALIDKDEAEPDAAEAETEANAALESAEAEDNV